MTTVLALAALNAANFESGDASAGQVLTADGAGGATFADVPSELPDYSGASQNDALIVNAGMFGYSLAFAPITPEGVTILSTGAMDGDVLTADKGGATWRAVEAGGGELTSDAPDGSILVVNAGSVQANGMYEPYGVNDGKTMYRSSLLNMILGWDANSGWLFYDEANEITLYLSPEDTATPDLVTVWVVENGVAPVPSLSLVDFYPENYLLVADGAGGIKWIRLIVAANQINASDGNAGQVLTADGAGRAAWQSLPPS